MRFGGEIVNILRRLIWPTLYLLSTIGLAHAEDGGNAIAIIIDDSSSMSKEPGRDGNDPEGNAARAAAFRVISEKAGTTLGYFTFGSATIQGAKPLIPAFEVPESMTERQKRLKAVIKGLKEENVKIARRAPGASNWVPRRRTPTGATKHPVSPP